VPGRLLNVEGVLFQVLLGAAHRQHCGLDALAYLVYHAVPQLPLIVEHGGLLLCVSLMAQGRRAAAGPVKREKLLLLLLLSVAGATVAYGLLQVLLRIQKHGNDF
jgi:hypothetical protein